jgi:hypothetical protein
MDFLVELSAKDLGFCFEELLCVLVAKFVFSVGGILIKTIQLPCIKHTELLFSVYSSVKNVASYVHHFLYFFPWVVRGLFQHSLALRGRLFLIMVEMEAS